MNKTCTDTKTESFKASVFWKALNTARYACKRVFLFYWNFGFKWTLASSIKRIFIEPLGRNALDPAPCEAVLRHKPLFHTSFVCIKRLNLQIRDVVCIVVVATALNGKTKQIKMERCRFCALIWCFAETHPGMLCMLRVCSVIALFYVSFQTILIIQDTINAWRHGK